MPDFYSKKHHYGNRTYKGILSRTELDEYLKANNAICEIIIFTRENHPDIVYFTDDSLSCLVFGISHENSSQITNSFPFCVKPRNGIEDGESLTIIPNEFKTKDVCVAAVFQDIKMLQHVPNELIDEVKSECDL